MPARGDAWIDSFDAPEAVWRLAAGQQHASLKTQERVRLTESGDSTKPSAGDSAGSVGAERILYECQPGLSAWFWRDVPPAALIEELRVVADLRTTTPGVLIAVEVVLPRALDPENGEPRRVVVRQRPLRPSGVGDLRLILDDLPRRLRARTRVLRAQEAVADGAPHSIDERGAYVTRVGVAAPGDLRARELWTKRLRIENLVRPPRLPARDGDAEANAGPLLTSPGNPPMGAPGGRVVPTRVSVDSEGLRVDGELFFPRVWRWRGEPLDLLAERGFNTIWSDRPLDRETIERAAQRRLRLFAPPPVDPSILRGVSLSPVLAWVLPGVATTKNVDTRLVAVEGCRALPPEQRRPVLVETDAPALWSRIADGLLIDTTNSRVSAAEATDGVLRSAEADCPPGTLFLSIVRADLTRRTQDQIDALLDGAIAPGWLSPRPVAQAVHASLAAGCRGIVFAANEPLNSPDDPTSLAADWLQASNDRLRLIEPWLVGPRARRDAGPETILLERSRVRLTATRPFPLDDRPPLVLSGVGDGAPLHRITPAGVSTVAASRVAGGLRIAVDDSVAPGALLFGHDARVVHSLRRYTARRGRRAAADLARMAGAALKQADAVDPAVASGAKRRISEANLALARGDHADAYDLAFAAIGVLETAAERRRRLADRAGTAVESSPLAILPATLTDHFTLISLLPSAQRGANRLAGGSFEDIDAVRRHGWRHEGTTGEGAAGVELAEGSAIHGARRLRMTSDAGAAQPPSVVSPTVELSEGELIEITGWARVDAASAGRLEIFDTLGGKELSLVLGPTDRWTPFRLLRRAPHATGVLIRFTLKGDATAEIDGVMLRRLRPAARRVETAARGESRGTTQPK